MDDDDRQNIIQKLVIANSNNHKIVQTINQQVNINNNFNESLCLIKNSILDDRKKTIWSVFANFESVEDTIQ